MIGLGRKIDVLRGMPGGGMRSDSESDEKEEFVELVLGVGVQVAIGFDGGVSRDKRSCGAKRAA